MSDARLSGPTVFFSLACLEMSFFVAGGREEVGRARCGGHRSACASARAPIVACVVIVGGN
jgi:hypothetical protein